VQLIALWIFIRKCACLDFKNGNTEKRHASAPTEISTPSPNRQRKVLTLEKIQRKIELIIASEKSPLYSYKDRQHAKNRYNLFIYSYKNIKKKETTMIY